MIVRDEIRIEVHPARVWDVTVDVERWAEWIPTVTSVVRTSAGSFGIGSLTDENRGLKTRRERLPSRAEG